MIQLGLLRWRINDDPPDRKILQSHLKIGFGVDARSIGRRHIQVVQRPASTDVDAELFIAPSKEVGMIRKITAKAS